VPGNVTKTFSNPPSLGPAAAELHADARILSLDLGGAIPEIDSTLTKASYGPLTVQLAGSGQPRTIATLSPEAYGRDRYERTAGIVDLPLPAGMSASDVQAGSIQIAAGGTVLLSDTGLSPAKLTVQTDDRGVWVDQSGTGSVTIQVRQAGVRPTQTVKVLLQQYLPAPPPPAANGGAWVVPSARQTAVISFQGAPQGIITVPVSAGGQATIRFDTVQPGFPTIAFFPFLDGQPTPKPPAQVIPVYVPSVGPLTIATAFYSAVRVMPFDNQLPGVFLDIWNRTRSKDLAWQFVYDQILYLYDLIFPVMKYYAGLDLGNRFVVDATIDLIVQLTDAGMLDTTVYMPVTRDLSRGKRTVLRLYAYLVHLNWPARPIEQDEALAWQPSPRAFAVPGAGG
jgi:hypothetical protein